MEFRAKVDTCGKAGQHISLNAKGNYETSAPVYGDGCALILAQDVEAGDEIYWECSGLLRTAKVYNSK